MQDEFADALLDHRAPVPAQLTSWKGDDCRQRFQLYRNNFVVSLIESLQAAFPVCCALTGEDFFRALARDFIYRHPPTSPVLIHYGQQFPAFIETFAAARSVPYLADMARLEQAWLSSYHSADSEALPMHELAQRLQQPDRLERARLQLAPACRVVSSAFPVLSIWQAHQPGAEGSLRDIDLAQAEAVLLTRPFLQVEMQLIETDAAEFLRRVQHGKLFSDAIDGLDFDLVALLHRLVQQGAISDLDCD